MFDSPTGAAAHALVLVSTLAFALHACASGSESSDDARDGGSRSLAERDAAEAPADATTISHEEGVSSSDASTTPTGSVQIEIGCHEKAALPALFVSQCRGCHAGEGRYPDLTKYAGTEATFIAKARAGGRAGGLEMPAFSAAVIDDATLRSAYRALTKAAAADVATGSVNIEPLFVDNPVLPIRFRRDDGVLLTRAAGRVRQRHELEETYGPFGPHYFEQRTYGFIVEDFTVRGESRVRVSYLPLARPEDKTNFRAFKIYGDGNVFHANMGMKSDVPLPSLRLSGEDRALDYARSVAPYARVQMQEVTSNPRSNRALRAGDLLEFEFGVFIDPAAATQGSRTSYYTDTFRYRVGEGGLTPENADTSGLLGPTSEARLGGDTTIAFVYAEPETALSQMALNIQHEHVQDFVAGRRLFHTDFGNGKHSEAGNPSFVEQTGKLGPLFVARSCVTCHPGNGGGRTPEAALGETSSMVFKLYDTKLGNQLQLSEGGAVLAGLESSVVTLGDATKVTLTRPTFTLNSSELRLAYSPRIARRLVGLGLLEAIDEQTLLSRADAADCDGDGISGRASIVRDPTGALRVGRFGWKAEKSSVEHQVADALDADLGVQTRLIPGAQNTVELADTELRQLSTYMRLLGVPPQRGVEDASVRRGAELFRATGCVHCHTPELQTGTHPLVELRGQTIHPFSDLLLHDMGSGLADQSGESATRAAPSEWRTAPLWGIAAARDAQGYVALLHDGRADSVLEALLWHGGEAAHIRARFEALGSAEREALLRFVESL